MRSRQKTVLAIGLSAVAAVALVFYGLNDPAGGHAPRCVLKALTGYDCPGCGAQRALHAVLHGDFVAAWGYNPILFFLVPLGALYAVAESFPDRLPRLRRVLIRPVVIMLVAAVIIAWWIIRNL